MTSIQGRIHTGARKGSRQASLFFALKHVRSWATTKGGCQACNRAAPIRAQDTPRRTRPVGPDPAGPSDRTDGRSHCPGRTAQKMSRWGRRGKDRWVSSSRSLSRSLSFLIFVPIIVSIFVDSTSTTRIGTMIKTRMVNGQGSRQRSGQRCKCPVSKRTHVLARHPSGRPGALPDLLLCRAPSRG